MNVGEFSKLLDAEAAKTTPPQRAAPQVKGTLPQEGTALLVDDDDLVRSSVSQMLSAIGYEVTEAKSAEVKSLGEHLATAQAETGKLSGELEERIAASTV